MVCGLALSHDLHDFSDEVEMISVASTTQFEVNKPFWITSKVFEEYIFSMQTMQMIKFSPFGDFKQTDGILDIETADKDSKAPNWFIFFSITTCHYCKAVYNDWQQFAAVTHQNSDSNLRIAQVDCTVPEQEELCWLFGVQRLPSFIFIKDNMFYVYPTHMDRSVPDFQFFADQWHYYAVQNEIPKDHESNMAKEDPQEFHINGYLLAFMTFMEMTAYMMQNTLRLPITYLNWWALAIFTLMINLSPFFMLPQFYKSVFDLCKRAEKKEDEFVRIDEKKKN